MCNADQILLKINGVILKEILFLALNREFTIYFPAETITLRLTFTIKSI